MTIHVKTRDHLCGVAFRAPSDLELRFADRTFLLPIEKLEMPMDRINWPTVSVAPTGEQMIVQGIKGDDIPIDSATLRYLVDEKYAAEMDAKLESLQFSEEELERLVRASETPDEWLDKPDGDMMRESWK